MKRISVLSTRMKTLLEKAANALDDLSDPFSTWWLVENEVGADECMALSESIAVIIRWFVKQPEDEKARILFSGLGPLGSFLALAVKRHNWRTAIDEAAK